MSEKRVCGFCGGQPVGNAATWLDGKPRPPAPCPRCGEVNSEKTEAEALAEAGLRALAVALLEAQLADLEAAVRTEAAA